MEFLASSDARIERLRGERTATLDQGRHVLVAALELPIERGPLLEDQLVDIDEELARRAEVADMAAAETAHVPQRGNPDSRDFDGLSDEDLERELRELAIGAGIAPKDSPVRVAAVNRMQGIDKELARRAEERRQ